MYNLMMAKKKTAAVDTFEDTDYMKIQYQTPKKFRNRRSNIRQVFKDHP